MSFLDNLFGASASRRDTANATNDAGRLLQGGYNTARADLNSGTTDAIAALRGGFRTGNRAINTGYGQARADINTGATTARGDINSGADAAIGAENQFLDRVQGLYDPYIQDGNAAGELYQNALGVNGQAAQQGFYDNFQQDPYFQYNQDQALEAQQRQMNAAGVGGGRAALAGQRVSQEMGSQALSERLNRLSGLYDMAVQASDKSAGYTAGAGARVAGYENGRGQDLAGIAQRSGENLASTAQNRGNALASNANSYYGNVANFKGQNAQSSADLAFGKAQLDANNRIGQGNADAATRGVGMNNLVKLAGTALQAAAPGASGTSAFGNIINGGR